MLDIKTTTQNARIPVTIMNVFGDIDSSNFHAFQANAEQLIQKGARHLLLNFQEVTHISSAGLRAVHNIFNILRSIHRDVSDDELRKKMSVGEYKSPYLKIVNLSGQIREVFELSGFDIYIETYDDLAAAVQSF